MQQFAKLCSFALEVFGYLHGTDEPLGVGGRVVADQQVESLWGVVDEALQVGLCGGLLVPAVLGQLGDPFVWGHGPAERSEAGAAPAPDAAAVSPPQRTAQMHRLAGSPRRDGVIAAAEACEAWPALVVAVHHHHRHRRLQRRIHQVRLSGCPAPPGGVLQPEVADLHQHVASLGCGQFQRRAEDPAVAVDVA